jgi:hypothetical protein
MPFTFAHPAVAIPLRRPLGRYGVLSALIIGSMTPDFAFFLPLGVARSQSHSLMGLWWFCLPCGIIAYLAFHSVLKRPWLALLPASVASRLATVRDTPLALPKASWLAVILSLMVGAVTHLVWDSFTHADGLAVTLLPWLKVRLVLLGRFHLPLYTILQYGSSAVGMLVLAWWSWRWVCDRPVRPLPVTGRLSVVARSVVMLALVGIPAGMVLVTTAEEVSTLRVMAVIRSFVGEVIFTGIPAFALLAFIYALGWCVWVLYGQRSVSSSVMQG